MVTIFWFRRDLRLHDNAALHYALQQQNAPVLPLFIFDRTILDDLEETADPRITFIYDEICRIKQTLENEKGSSIIIKYGYPLEVFKQLTQDYDIEAVYTNRDYEPYAIQRDGDTEQFLQTHQIPFYDFKDQVIYEKDEILTGNGQPYKVFTPYKNTWMKQLDASMLQPFSLDISNSDHWAQTAPLSMPTLHEMGFSRSAMEIPSRNISEATIKKYDQLRNYPAEYGTSRLGIHLRFGTISIRELALKAFHLNHTYLNELTWRDFYMQIMYHFPYVVDHSFKPEYDHIPWQNDGEDFQKWCEGRTGFPIVDAGMRELNANGYMHNRVRMITASFLTKHLLIDWRWGERYFARKLLDYELANNNGGWQWAAGSGTDAQPYFRVFNPTTQLEKFDPYRKYISKWVPEVETSQYPPPMVDHKTARQQAISTFKSSIEKAKQ